MIYCDDHQYYTRDQIGPIVVRPINNKTRGHFSLILLERGDGAGRQITVMEPTDQWSGEIRVWCMIAAGVDPGDLRAVIRPLGHGMTNTDGLPLVSIKFPLWWLPSDQRRLEAEGRGWVKDAVKLQRWEMRGAWGEE